MSAVTTSPATPAIVSPRVSSSVGRLNRLRTLLLALASWTVAFGLLAGLISWRSAVAVRDEYETLTVEGARSVDAALTARAAALDHLGAAATFLESGGDRRYREEADRHWRDYSEASRISWQNRTDALHGEYTTFAAADAAASTYVQQIGAMYSFLQSGQRDQAEAAMLAARDTMDTRLVPALGGLEAVKVEGMEVAYAGTERRLSLWRRAVIAATGLLMLGLLAGLLTIRRMRYRWSWPVGLAVLGVLTLVAFGQSALGRAALDSRVLVRQAYEGVAGTEDLEALVSRQRALESIAVFDRRPGMAAGHLDDFREYTALVEQKLCGPIGCTQTPFIDPDGRMTAQAVERANAEATKLGLPRSPLIGNAPFEGQANAYEGVRRAYAAWLAEHGKLEAALEAGRAEEASRLSRGLAASAFARLETAVGRAVDVPRGEFAEIRDRAYAASGILAPLSAVFPIAGSLAAWGLLRRRRELFSGA